MANCIVSSTHLVAVESPESALSPIGDFHISQGHPAVGVIARSLRHRVWHPEYELLVQESVITRRECATGLPVHHLRQQLTPVPQSEPFVTWPMDYTKPLTN